MSDGLSDILQQAIEIFKSADQERHDELMEYRDEAEEWKREGDMYGWNFHQGRAAGCNAASIIFFRVLRFLEEQKTKCEADNGNKSNK